MTARPGSSLAASAALFALTAIAMAGPASAAESKVHCYGINACKGTSDCKTAMNECKGQNSCKGHGFKEMTAQQCTAAGGRLTEK
jgi:uncharacterized membrane protein